MYLIGRTLAVSLYSASINDESKKPLEVFRAVSRHEWGVEVKRFNEEVANDMIALSGMKFFYLTRKLVLSVAGKFTIEEQARNQSNFLLNCRDHNHIRGTFWLVLHFLSFMFPRLHSWSWSSSTRTTRFPITIRARGNYDDDLFVLHLLEISSFTVTSSHSNRFNCRVIIFPFFSLHYLRFQSRNQTAQNLIYG